MTTDDPGITITILSGVATIIGLQENYTIEHSTGPNTHTRTLYLNTGVKGAPDHASFDLGNFQLSQTNSSMEPIGSKIIFEDDGPISNLSASSDVDEDGLTDGNTGGPADADLPTTPESMVSYSLTGLVTATGVDAPVTFSLSSDTSGLTTGLKSKGGTVVYEVNGTGTILTGYVDNGTTSGSLDAGDREVFTLKLTGTNKGTSTFTLLDQLDHGEVFATNSEDIRDDIEIDFTSVIEASDADDDVISLEGYSVFVNDDTPLETTTEIAVGVEEEALTDGNPDSSDIANTVDAVTVSGSLQALVFVGADEVTDGGDDADFSFGDLTGLPDLTSLDATLHYALDIATGTILKANTESDGSGRDVFTLSLAANGDYTFTLLDQLDHSAPVPPAISVENGIVIDFSSAIVATDYDDDSIVLSADAFKVTVEDDTPLETTTEIAVGVEEEALTGGNTDDDGTYDTDNDSASVSGNLQALVLVGADEVTDGGDDADFSFGDLTGLPDLTSLDATLHYALDIATGTILTANTESDGSGRDVFTLSLAANGDYTFTLLDQLDQLDHSAPVPPAISVENGIVIDFSSAIVATDYDDDSIVLSADAFKVTVEDDTPLTLEPGDIIVGNEVGQIATAALGYIGKVGADADGATNFVGSDGAFLWGAVQDGTPTSEKLQNAGSDIYLFGFDTDTLIGTTSSDNTVPGSKVFQMTLNPDGLAGDSDFYDIELFKTIDAIVDVEFGDRTGEAASGNPLTLVIDDIGGSTVDALFSGFLDTGDYLDPASTTKIQTTVNVSGAGVGVGTGQDFNFYLNGSDPSDDVADRIQIEFLEDDGNGTLDVGESVTVNQFKWTINQNNSPADDGDALIRTYDVTGAGAAVEVQITSILVNGVEVIGAGLTDVPSNDGGYVTALPQGLGYELHGLGGGTGENDADNDSITIVTAHGYNRIDITGIGEDANKDTFDMLLESVAVPTPFDITFAVQADLTDEDGDGTTAVNLDVTLDADGVFSSSALIGESLDATSVTTIGTNFDDPGLIA